MVERLILVQEVEGSIPSRPTNIFSHTIGSHEAGGCDVCSTKVSAAFAGALTMSFMERAQVAALVVSSHPAANIKLPTGPEVPLAPIAGKSVLGWVIDAVLGASVRRIAVLTNEPTSQTRSELAHRTDRAMIEFVAPSRDIAESVFFALERLGSAFTLSETAHLLILPAEAPQIQTTELRALVEAHLASNATATLMAAAETLEIDDHEPIVTRDGSGRVVSIADASAGPTGILCINASVLLPSLRRVGSTSWRRPVPFAEILQVLDGLGHQTRVIERAEALQTISTVATRTPIEIELHDRVIAGWLDRGTAMPDPRQVTIDATATLGQGVRVLPGTVIEGVTVIGDGAVVGPNTHLIDALIGTGAKVPHSVVMNAEVQAREQVPPFSVLGSAAL